MPFFSCSGSEFVEMFVGVGASRVRDLFKKGAPPPASAQRGAMVPHVALTVERLDSFNNLQPTPFRTYGTVRLHLTPPQNTNEI